MKKSLLFLALALFSVNGLHSQCKRMAKKCIKKLTPYKFNGQLNKVVLTEGESAELVMIFRGGKKYRVQTCSGKSFGKLGLKLLDRNKKVIFDNADQDYAPAWDFEVGATQQFTVVVTVPEGGKGFSDISSRGCVALLVGYLDNNDKKTQNAQAGVDSSTSTSSN